MSKQKSNLSTLITLTLLACLVYAVATGIRNNYGIMLIHIAENAGITYASASTVLAIGQLVFGLTQPLFGVLALKKSNPFVMTCGVLCMVVGLVMVPMCHGVWLLAFFLGVVLPSGTGALSFGIIMGAISPRLGEKDAATVSGIVNASSGVVNMFLAPLLQTMLGIFGLRLTMFALAVPTFLLLPVSLLLCRNGAAPAETAEEANSGNPFLLFWDALKDPTFQSLVLVFIVAGFHMGLIETHVYSQMLSYGIDPLIASWAMSVCGMSAMLGSIFCGIACRKFLMKQILGFHMVARIILVIVFLLLPKNVITCFAFVISLGLTGAGINVPGSNLISKTFGAAKLAMLFGFLFFVHQVGGSISSWLCGVFVDQLSSYTPAWIVDIGVCAVAALISWRIRESASE